MHLKFPSSLKKTVLELSLIIQESYEKWTSISIFERPVFCAYRILPSPHLLNPFQPVKLQRAKGNLQKQSRQSRIVNSHERGFTDTFF